jgi:hypothetical protein
MLLIPKTKRGVSSQILQSCLCGPAPPFKARIAYTFSFFIMVSSLIKELLMTVLLKF